MSETSTETTTNEPAAPTDEGSGGPSQFFKDLFGVGSSVREAVLTPTLAIATALIVAGFIVAVTDVETLGLWTSDPGTALTTTLSDVGGAYRSLFVGAFGSANAWSETLFAATPLILAGLAVAIGFQAGFFNIGAEGQMLIGGISALFIGFTLDLPGPIIIPLAIAGAIVGGAVWGGFAGWLRATTGAHEVITTIMLNFIAASLVQFLLKTSLFQQEGRNDPISKPLNEAARFGRIFSDDLRVTIGLAIALAAVAATWWLIFRSTVGFQYRAVGASPSAARYAGMNVTWLTVAAMSTSGALAGVAGANQIMALPPYQAQAGFSGGVGFDAITLALVGRSRPIGVLWAGILFGALEAGGREMQAAERIPSDLVEVIQGLVIVFIAAPSLVKNIWRVGNKGEAVTQ